MTPTAANTLRFPCRSGWCSLRGLALLVLWVALVAGFLADTTMASSARAGSAARTASECPAEPATAT